MYLYVYINICIYMFRLITTIIRRQINIVRKNSVKIHQIRFHRILVQVEMWQLR
jgi:hypothetical protein